VFGKALMRYASAVSIQVLSIVTGRMLYSNNWDVNDFSGFFLIYVGYTFAFLPLQKMRTQSVFTHAKMSEGYTENG
jgi:hypothetical protein